MRGFVAVLYTALILGANAAIADVSELRTGDMKKLNLVAATDLPDIPVYDQMDQPQSLDDLKGKWVVLNFWATWCAPCRHEMPSLDRLQTAMPDLIVLPVATGRNSVEGITSFYAEAGVFNLPVVRDPKSELARNMAVLGLPVTVIINPQGQEVARLIGDAEWDSADAQTILAAMMAEGN
jgi:thiol-disulfide isomerase/thioredoxin